MTTALSGMKAIRDYCRSINLSSSEASIIQMIKDYGFPARKLCGIWESDREAIAAWRKQYVMNDAASDAEAKTISQQPADKRRLYRKNGA